MLKNNAVSNNAGDRSDHQLRIDEFMRKAGQEVLDYPFMPSVIIRRLRANLIIEEAIETIEALGFVVTIKPTNAGQFASHYHERPLIQEHGYRPDIEQVADGCADISVVTVGTLSAFGIADNKLFRIVDNSNLAKFAEGGYLREDGKWIKPPNWVKPDILQLLIEQGYDNNA